VPVADLATDLTTPDASLSTRTDIEGGYKVGPIYFGGYGYLNNTFVMYNEFYKSNGTTLQNYGHCASDYSDNLYFAYNLVRESGTSMDNHRPSLILGGGDLCASRNGDVAGTHYVYARHAFVYNNVFLNNWSADVRTGDNTLGGGSGNISIWNNTFYSLSTGDTSLQLGGVSTGVIEFKNNIVYSNNRDYNSCYYGPSFTCVNVTGSNNLWYGKGVGPSWSTGNINSVSPLFVDSSAGDLSLSPTSPAVNTGLISVPSFVTNDFNGISRPQGLGYDIGAFEYVDPNDITSPSAPSGVSVN
jgi:hypothetical protein